MAKRANGEGTIRKRADNRWEGRYYDQIEKKQKSVYGKTQIEVVKRLQYIQCTVGNEEYIEENNILFNVWINVWLDNYTAHLKPLTLTSYKGIAKNHLIPALGDYTLKQINTSLIQAFYKQKMKSLSAKTLRNIHGCLHKCLQKAVELKIYQLKDNPADKCSLPRVEEYEYNVFENDDVKKLLKGIQLSNIYDQIAIVGLFTGMRQSEILGLRWKDVDFQSETAYIKRQLQKDKVVHPEYNSKYFIGKTPKGNKGRLVRFADFVVDILKLRKQQQINDREQLEEDWIGELPINNDLIFTHPNGGHLSHCTVYKNYKKLLRRCSLTPTRFHDLRHSYAVISLEIGENIKTVQFNMGHYSAAFMLKKYGHITQGMRNSSAERMQQYIDTQNIKNDNGKTMQFS